MVFWMVLMETYLSRRAFVKLGLLEHLREGGLAFYVDRRVIFLCKFPDETLQVG